MTRSREYQKLLDKRENAIRALKFHEGKVKDMGDDKQIEAMQRLNLIEPTYDKFKEICDSLEDHDEFTYSDLAIPNEDVTEIVVVTCAKLNIIAKNSEGSLLNSTQHRGASALSAEIKLPRIEIPKFSGKYEEWTAFHDAFMSLVDSNDKLVDVNRMHYLRSSLEGTALSLICKMPVTDANYKVALQNLTERFDNKRAIVNACLQIFTNQPGMTRSSAEEIRSLIDTTKEALQCIDANRIPIDEWDPFIVFIVQSKMDNRTKIEWETHLKGAKTIPKYKDLLVFLETQYRILDVSNLSLQNDGSTKTQHKVIASVNNTYKNDSEICVMCSGDHWILRCSQFDAMSPRQRKKFILDKGMCIRCLHAHQEPCKSKYRCKKCSGTHSVKLHIDEEDNLPCSSNMSSTNVATMQNGGNLLATALIKVKDKSGASHVLRVFIDQGSQGTMISERAAQLLCLPRKREKIPMTGVDNVSLGKSTNSVRIQVESLIDDAFKLSLEAYVLRSIITPQIHSQNSKNWNHLNDIPLADPHYLNPSHIDLLFGVDMYGIILKDGLRKGQAHEPVAQNSHLGWIVFGAISEKSSFGIQVNAISIENQLRKFWENEEVLVEPILTEEQVQCIEHFQSTHKRLSDGSFMVSLPFNMNPSDPKFLGESKKMALCRLFQIEKRFRRDPLYKQRYHEEINGYLERNHMSLCKKNSVDGYFLPHHAVVRESSTTTKQRTVYDASAKSSNGSSLNDRCLNGPTIQPELFETFIRWRMHKIALNADIEKMYRMIKMRPEDRKFQKILWRFSENEPIKTYELNTVTFGTKPAPYLAIATTFALADAEKDNFPEAAKRVKTDFYVDDCMSGSHSIDSAIKLQKELDGLFKSGHFLLRKWASNDPLVLQQIEPENRAIKTAFEFNLDETVKTLGLVWTPKSDELSFTIDMSCFHTNPSMTKRQLLSDASKIYDPCGLISPIIILSKIAMQDVWKSGTDWDVNVPPEIQVRWNIYKKELPLIEKIKRKRWFQTELNSNISLHGFCDSSEKAMACAIYIVQQSNNNITSTLVCSKTKVAPIATQSIPRLELNAALLLSDLMAKVARTLKIPKRAIYMWTDSSIVITWLQAHSSRWLPYVAVRVSHIQQKFKSHHWQHVRTHENPADIASRGVLPSELIENQMWFCGPHWLLLDKSEWPNLEVPPPPLSKLEAKPTVKVNAVTIEPKIIEAEFLTRFISCDKLVRFTALILRFMYNSRRKETLKYTKAVITVDELDRAEFYWTKYVQSLHFEKELNYLRKNEYIGERSSLKALNPQINENGLMILHGRLQYADFAPLRKFPIILPAESHFSKLVIKRAHTRSNHGSIHLTLATLRNEYWVINARNMVKTHIRKCITCFRSNPKPLTQLMAPLPRMKTKPSRGFLHCGMDFAGPFDIKDSSLRNAKTIKGYVCVFVCMKSKAVHLEVVGDLSTQKFIGAFRRFVSTRGFCTDVYCDQGTNFKGASNELPLLFMQAESESSIHIQATFANDRVRFHFNPPSAPHWGGQWESFVKLTKHHLNRISVSTRLTFEDMLTLIKQTEACINSRPLCAITSDVNDLDPITAGHLLIGGPLNLIPEPSLLSVKDNTLDQYQAVQKSVQSFWKRFYVEYLHTMHPRKKWYKPGVELKLNDLVVIIDDNLPPTKWLMGRVIEMHPGIDGNIRMVTLQTKAKDDDYGQSINGQRIIKKPSTLQRPIAKLCKLPLPSSN